MSIVPAASREASHRLRQLAREMGIDPIDLAWTPDEALPALINGWEEAKPYLVDDAADDWDSDSRQHQGAQVYTIPFRPRIVASGGFTGGDAA